MTESIILHPSFSPASISDIITIFETDLVNEFIIRFGRSSYAFNMMCAHNNMRAIRKHLLDAKHSPLNRWNMHVPEEHLGETPMVMIIFHRDRFGRHMFKELMQYVIDTGQSINMPYQTWSGGVVRVWCIRYDPTQSTTIYHIIAPLCIDLFSVEEINRAPFDSLGRTPYMLNYNISKNWKEHKNIYKWDALCVGGDGYKQQHHRLLGRAIHEKIFMIYACGRMRAGIQYEIIEQICGFFKLNEFLDDFVGAYGF